MAKKQAAKTAKTGLIQVTFQHLNDTKNARRFNEDVPAGEQSKIQSLYLLNTILPECTRPTLTLEVGKAEDASDVTCTPILVLFEKGAEMKGSWRYNEVLEEGVTRGYVGSLYVNKTAFGGEEAPDFLLASIEG